MPDAAAHADDHAVAAALAVSAGELLLALRAEMGHADPAELRAAGDAHAHQHLVDRLAELRPDDAVLSEEGKDDPARLSAPRVWVVDPLDGTREYGEEGRDDWAVHVALWAGGSLTAGAVALPARGQVLSTGVPLRTPAPRPGVRMAVSRSRPHAITQPVADALGAELVPMGSAGVKATAVVTGEVDLYVHAGGMYEWDSAAPVAVALHAGLHASRVDGSPLEYNRPDPLLPDLLVCRPDLAAAALAAIESAS